MTHARSTVVRRVVALLAMGLFMTSCAGGSDPNAQGSTPAAPDAAETPAGEPKTGGELRFQLLRDADAGYDPGLATLSTVYTIDQAIFDTLAEVQPDGSLEPSLATSWTISDDELTYTFDIREGVVFHNGREMTAADVKYTIDRLRDPATNSPRQGIYAVVDSVEAPDDTTVVVHLSEPFAPLLPALADITAGIVPQEVVEAEGGNLHQNPVGTGPFRFVEWVVDRHVKVEANPDYWREELPYLDSITYSFNDDGNARAANVRSGTIDFLWNATPEMVDVLRDDPVIDVYGGEGTQSFQYLLLNMQRAPFDEPEVRQAIYWALDREAIRLVSRPGTTTPLNSGFLPPDHWAGVPEESWIYTQDHERASQLLDEAGYGAGFDMEILVLTGSDFHIRSAQVIQEQLAPLGINVSVLTVDSGQQTERRDSGDFDAIVTGFSGTIDPDERISQTFVTGGGTNYADFSDADVDQLAAEARRTSDQSARGEIYRQIQLKLAEVGPMAFIYNYHFVDALQSYVKGYVFNPQLVDYRSVRQIWLDN